VEWGVTLDCEIVKLVLRVSEHKKKAHKAQKATRKAPKLIQNNQKSGSGEKRLKNEEKSWR
jgi:hypothetical protein